MWWYLLLSIGLLSFGAYSLLLVHRKLGPKPGANVKYDAWLASSAVLFKIVGWGEIILGAMAVFFFVATRLVSWLGRS